MAPIRQVSVILLDTKQNNPNFYIVLAIEAALRSHQLIASVVRADYSSAVALAQQTRFDVLLAVDGEEANAEILYRLRSLVGFAVLWCWEDPYETTATAALGKLFDCVFTNDSASVDMYAPPANYLPLAASEKHEVLAKESDYESDIAFVGSAWPNRVVFLRKLLRVRPELRARICLSYNEHLPNVYLDLPESNYVGAVSHADFLKTVNRSKITLVLHRRFSGDGLSRCSQTPGPRLFEAALAGACQLVDGQGMSLDGLYQDGKEIVTFQGMDDCVAKIDWLLKSPKRRMMVAHAAQKRTALEHTYTARISSILDVIPPAMTRPSFIPSIVMHHERQKRLLFVTHNRVANGNFGGVEVYQETIADQMRANYEIFYCQPQTSSNPGVARDYVLTDSRHRVLRAIRVPDFDPMTVLWQPESEDAFAGLLTEFKIELVHFHHLINHSPSLPLVCRVLGIPTVYTFQDFWAVCSRFNLIDYTKRFCRTHERGRTACDVCLEASDGRPSGSQAVRRSFFSQVLRSIDRIVFNSPSSAEICRRVFPELPETTYVSLGLPLPWATMHRQTPLRSMPAARDARNPLRVVFLGNFTFGKGAETFLEVARFMRHDNVAFTVAGRVDADYAARLTGATTLNVTVTGGFEPGTLDLSLFDISLHLSVWPETYCITLSEAWKAGVVPIVTACGALADRVHDGIDGFAIPIDGAGELIELLRRLESNRRELAEISANVGPSLWLTPEQHCETLQAVYRDLHAARPAPPNRASVHTSGSICIHPVLTTSRNFPPTWPQADWPALPPLPTPNLVLKNPAQARIAAVRAAVGERAFDTIALPVCIDAFGGISSQDASAYGLTVLSPAAGAIQLCGWVQANGNLLEGLCLMVRSCSGDLILRPAYLHERPDIEFSPEFGTRLGFVTNSFAPELLEDDCVYALEFAMWNHGRLVICPLQAAISRRNGVTTLIQSARTYPVREPFSGPASPSQVELYHSEPCRYHLDEVTVQNIAEATQPPVLVLKVSGWILGANTGGALVSIELELRGTVTCYCELAVVARPDVLEAFPTSSPHDRGFQGALWLGSLAAGQYSMFLRYHEEVGRSDLLVGNVFIGTDSAETSTLDQPDILEMGEVA